MASLSTQNPTWRVWMAFGCLHTYRAMAGGLEGRTNMKSWTITVPEISIPTDRGYLLPCPKDPSLAPQVAGLRRCVSALPPF
jgi:hypothetical protein